MNVSKLQMSEKEKIKNYADLRMKHKLKLFLTHANNNKSKILR